MNNNLSLALIRFIGETSILHFYIAGKEIIIYRVQSILHPAQKET